MPEVKPSSPSLWKAVVSGVVIVGVVLFGVIAMNTGDILWFWPVFREVPVDIVVNCYGTEKDIKPGTSAFEVVNSAVNTSLTGVKRWDQLSMSEVTYQDYQTSASMMVLQLHYDPPVTVHSQYAFMKAVNWLIIPLDGRHAPTNPVFGLEGDYIDPGSYHVKTTAPIITALQEQAVCSKR